MQLTARSLYGTRLLLDMAEYYGKGPIKLKVIAKRQNISVKYLELIIRTLKNGNYIRSFRGPRGGHVLSKPPDKITVGEIVALLEGSSFLTPCSASFKFCKRSGKCLTRQLWIEASRVLFGCLNQITFADLLSGKSISRLSNA